MIWWIEGSSPNKDGTLFPGFSCKTFRNVEMLMSPVTKYQSTSTNGRGKNIKKMTNVGSHGLGNSGDWYLMIILVLINWGSLFFDFQPFAILWVAVTGLDEEEGGHECPECPVAARKGY